MIEVEGLKASRDGREILHGLSLNLAPGQLTAVVGPNGAGKSTLLRTLCGVGAEVSGAVTINARPLESYDQLELAKTVAYLPQDHHVSWPITVRRVVALGRSPYTSTLARLSEDDSEQIAKAMKAMAVTHLADRAATALSGGELARVLVARLLAQNTPIVIADEPGAGLDPAHALSLFEHFKHIAEAGRLVVVAMHDLSFALRYCDQVLLLKGGNAVAFGPARDVLTRTHIEAAYGVTASIGEVDGVPVVLPLENLTS